jgi:hypothetical protein
LGVANALAAFRSAGSTSPYEVGKQLTRWRQRLTPGQNHQPAIAMPLPQLSAPPTKTPAAPVLKVVKLSVRDNETKAESIRSLGEEDEVWAATITIGSDPGCTLVLPGVAPKQVVLTRMNRHIFLRALAEGARVGGSPLVVDEKRLLDAREFFIGRYTLRLL